MASQRFYFPFLFIVFLSLLYLICCEVSGEDEILKNTRDEARQVKLFSQIMKIYKNNILSIQKNIGGINDNSIIELDIKKFYREIKYFEESLKIFCFNKEELKIPKTEVIAKSKNKINDLEEEIEYTYKIPKKLIITQDSNSLIKLQTESISKRYFDMINQHEISNFRTFTELYMCKVDEELYFVSNYDNFESVERKLLMDIDDDIDFLESIGSFGIIGKNLSNMHLLNSNIYYNNYLMNRLIYNNEILMDNSEMYSKELYSLFPFLNANYHSPFLNRVFYHSLFEMLIVIEEKEEIEIDKEKFIHDIQKKYREDGMFQSIITYIHGNVFLDNVIQPKGRFSFSDPSNYEYLYRLDIEDDKENSNNYEYGSFFHVGSPEIDYFTLLNDMKLVIKNDFEDDYTLDEINRFESIYMIKYCQYFMKPILSIYKRLVRKTEEERKMIIEDLDKLINFFNIKKKFGEDYDENLFNFLKNIQKNIQLVENNISKLDSCQFPVSDKYLDVVNDYIKILALEKSYEKYIRKDIEVKEYYTFKSSFPDYC